jgi:branched-subunit amino acid transport protein
MTWTLVILLAVGAYGFKALGLVVLGGRTLPAPLDRCLALIPAALIAALVVKDTFSTGQELVLDARAAGVAAAVVAAWRQAPLIAVIVIGATVTALVRAI